MYAKRNIIIAISLVIYSCVVVWASVYFWYFYTGDKSFNKNRKIEYKFLIKMVNNSNKTLHYFESNFSDKLKKINHNTYYINADTVYGLNFNQDMYDFEKSSFYGYEFVFDDAGKLERFNLYKP